MQVSEAIRMKRAVREFQDQPLPEQITNTILNAGRRAQSAKNTQPWSFIAIQDKPTLKALSEVREFAGHLAGAALGVAIITPDPAERFSIMFDAGQAAAYMQLAAWELGVGSCMATIFDREAARQLLAYPPHLHLFVAISFGYPVDQANLTTPPQKGGRRSMDDVVHWEKW